MEATLTGWGRTAPTTARLRAPGTAADVADALRDAGGRGVLARGLGRSYGDAAQNAGGTVLDMTALSAIRALDLERGQVTCEAGVSLDRLMRLLLPFGWFVPVTPGTRYVTVGGAIGADIHGKNHHVSGSLSRHVTRFSLLTADGAVREVAPGDELFDATAGGMGLTGVILDATVQLLPVGTSLMSVDTERAADLDDLMDRLTSTDHRYRYSVAWIDLVARGAATGRAVLTRGDHATPDQLSPRQLADPLAFRPRSLPAAPRGIPGGLLRTGTVGVFNELWFRKAPRERRGQLQGIGAFFHPLDGVPDWNRVYGPAGFLQYQFVVPYGQEETLRGIVGQLSRHGCPSFLAVLKRFGEGGSGWLSFPMPGWTLALDLPATVPGLGPLLDRLDEQVLAVGGRVYLAKDSRMRPGTLHGMYPRLGAFRALRQRIDPRGVFTSDLARRLQL
ncbi:FAD-binding oxidoreductase [Streptacidiphilus fuscans]|uniref:FAD-binding oxidoreductase n=1 Tax=Streptacidiphilus fuscans TaxID=2789292 RepID=A0A931B8K9_9ACTN|nr:FAD-binding oxidoreductase [Streptacidiphilus fuscans]MBF9073210.1 FAD-binding oxidoreductase [Streptacidiphilus fuscans]